MIEGHNAHRRRVILLVDDHADIRRAMALLLRTEGITLLEAGTGHEALRIFGSRDGEIDLLISDMKMPGMDGVALMGEILHQKKALHHPWQMKAIAVTAYPKEYTKSDTAKFSFDEYIEKSSDFFDALLRTSRELVNS